MKYAIWGRFSPEARRAAASATYAIRTIGGRVTEDGCCPLGVAMKVDGLRNRNDQLTDWSAPRAEDVADAITHDDLDDGWECRLAVIEEHARDFIQDWDGGNIDPADLTRLLEVE